MEFRFNLQPIFAQPIVKVNSNLLPHTFRGDRRTALDTTTKIAEIINTMGELSAKAQGLSKPVTTAQKLRTSDQNIYLLGDLEASKSGAVVGILKVGKKSLYVFDDNGETKTVNAPCVLDFYVHESRQRAGLGKNLFETMLQEEKFIPEKMAVDRPSDKLLGFLRKHYGLQKTIPQMNNFVVYEGFFEKPNTNNNQGHDAGVHITDSPNTALFGQQFTNDDKRRLKPQQKNSAVMPQFQSGPVGRYAAARPMCSMGECLNSEGTQKAIISAASKSSVHSRSPNQNISDALNRKNESNIPVQDNAIPEQSNANNECTMKMSTEIVRNCNACGYDHVVPTDNQLVMPTSKTPSQTEHILPSNKIPNDLKQNEQHLSGTQSPQEASSRILLQRKLAEKRAGLQGTTMDNFCASNTSIQTCGMDNPLPLGVANELIVNQTFTSSGDHSNHVASSPSKISNTAPRKANESQPHFQPMQNLNPSEPVEQTQVKPTEVCPEGGTNTAMNLEEFQEVCPKCSTTFISSRASSTKKGITLQEQPLNQKILHQTNDTIINGSAMPVTGEPNREL